MPEPNSELVYAPAPALHQRPWFGWLLRRVVVVVLVLLVLFWAQVWRVWGRYRLPVKLADGAARYYTPPTTQHVVYDDDPQTYPQLLAGGGGYVSSASTIAGGKAAVYDNVAFDRLVNAQAGGGRTYTLPVAFLHELVSPKGNRRIVAVQISTTKADPFNRVWFSGYPMDAPPVLPPARPMTSPALVMHRAGGATLRIYDGLVDPADNSRFVIVVEHNGQRIQIRGQLRDDEKVILTPPIGLVADFRSELAWIAPGASIPKNYEPSCFVNIATTQPTQYLMSPPGIRESIDANGQLFIEYLKSGQTRREALPPGFPK